VEKLISSKKDVTTYMINTRVERLIYGTDAIYEMKKERNDAIIEVILLFFFRKFN